MIPSRLKIPTHVRLPLTVYVENPLREIAQFEREVRMAQRLLSEVVQAVLRLRISRLSSSSVIVIIVVGDGWGG